MTQPADARDRQPKGDHNRRISLGLEREEFAAEAGLTTEELRKYEMTPVDEDFDPGVAQSVGEALERLEAKLPREAVRVVPSGTARSDS